MILYATKETIQRFGIPMIDELSDFNQVLAKKLIEEQTGDPLLEWGIKIFYFDRRKCVQAVNYASKMAIFLFDLKNDEIAYISNAIAQYLLNIFENDKEMEKTLKKFFEDYPFCTFSKISNRSIISSLNHNQLEFAGDGDAFYDYIENGVLKTKDINKEFNWEWITTNTINGKKEYIYPAKCFREMLLKRYS